MKRIGIDRSTHDIYESSYGVWHSVWPATPVVSVAAFVDPEIDPPAFESALESAGMVFREDSFDPVTRIRRGRFYGCSGGSRPSQEFASPHPIYGTRGSGPAPAPDGRSERWLFVFDQYQTDASGKMVMVGSTDSLWRILGAERITTGEYLVTLKARHALGVLPVLNPDAMPDLGRERPPKPTRSSLIPPIGKRPAPSWTGRAMPLNGAWVPGQRISTATTRCFMKIWENLSRK